eukprot:1179657-Prorocentrum_minimum.AAC.9
MFNRSSGIEVLLVSGRQRQRALLASTLVRIWTLRDLHGRRLAPTNSILSDETSPAGTAIGHPP